MSRPLTEIAAEIDRLLAENDGKIPELDRMRIEDELTNKAWTCARLLDRAKGIDPLKGDNGYSLGTPNHRSFTYKVRKALGYSYP